MSRLIALTVALLLALPAFAQAQADQLGKCFADNTTGRDRKDLARWIFVSMAAHPEIRDMANPSQDVAQEVSRAMGLLVTRLITESCPKEVQAVFGGEGSQAIRRAFENLVQLDLSELMSNAEVSASISGFERYLDRGKINAVLRSK